LANETRLDNAIKKFNEGKSFEKELIEEWNTNTFL
jgi:hypothetical protein